MRGRVKQSMLIGRLAMLCLLGLCSMAWAQNPKSIAVGRGHAMAVKAGQVWSWGANAYGQLGRDPNLSYDLEPGFVELEDIVAVAAGDYHSLALDGNGVVWSWGLNEDGQLGDGTFDNHSAPVSINEVLNLDVVWIAIDAGPHFSMALDDAGDVWCWGENSQYQLGIATSTESKPEPTRVTASIDAASTFCAGRTHTLMVVDSILYGWGRGRERQLRVKATSNLTSPSLLNTPAEGQFVAAGESHSLAIDAEGEVMAWGSNENGQVGEDLNTTNPVPIYPVFTDDVNIVEVYAGAWHSLALDANDSLWTWGDNQLGQLGSGSTEDQNEIPALVMTDVNEIEASYVYNLALDHNGVGWGWGQLLLDHEDVNDPHSFEPERISGFPCVLEIGSTEGGEVIEPEEGTSIYALGEQITVKAKPLDHYDFDAWIGTAVDQGLVSDPHQMEITVLIDGDHTLDANFTPTTYTLTTQDANERGTVIVPGVGEYPGYTHLTPVDIEAQSARDEYAFEKWLLISGEGTFDDINKISTTITLADDCTIRPQFKEVQLAGITDEALLEVVIETLAKDYNEDVNEQPNVEQMALIVELDASDAGVEDLTGLRWATQLTKLNLNGNNVTDVNELSSIGSLQILLLDENQNLDLSIAAQLTDVKVLHLNGISIPDYGVLDAFGHLTTLMINRTNQEIGDIPENWLKDLAQMQVLGLRGNQGLTKQDTNVRRMKNEVCEPNGGTVLVD